MSTLYIITGPAGVGKSTISRELAKQQEKSVLIEGDEIYHHVVGGYVSPWKEGNHLEIFWKVCINTIKTYLEAGYTVVFNYIISPKDLKYIQEQITNHQTKFSVLLVDENTLLKRDKERPLDCQMNERCIVLLNNFKNHNYNKKNIIDTSNLSIIDIVNLINNSDNFII